MPTPITAAPHREELPACDHCHHVHHNDKQHMWIPVPENATLWSNVVFRLDKHVAMVADGLALGQYCLYQDWRRVTTAKAQKYDGRLRDSKKGGKRGREPRGTAVQQFDRLRLRHVRMKFTRALSIPGGEEHQHDGKTSGRGIDGRPWEGRFRRCRVLCIEHRTERRTAVLLVQFAAVTPACT